MEKGRQWHPKFTPRTFIQAVRVENLITPTQVERESEVHDLPKTCTLCGEVHQRHLRLNDDSFLCESCLQKLSLVEFPEKYEQRKREYLIGCKARQEARTATTKKSVWRIVSLWLQSFIVASLSLLFVDRVYIVAPVLLGALAWLCGRVHERMLAQWDASFPLPKKPLLKHFPDPEADLTPWDQAVLHVFDHWPGYPPYWDYLRLIVLDRDGHTCQVTGCPSRLTLHIHHRKPTSRGGAHRPENLVALCEFHHALQPEPGHERVWGNVRTRYFTLVRSHTRRSRASMNTHEVRAHLRRLELVSSADLISIIQRHGMQCPFCDCDAVQVEVDSHRNKILIICPDCEDFWEGPQQLAEETGPRLAELLNVTRCQGSWFPNWSMLEQRQNKDVAIWQRGKSKSSQRKRQKKNARRQSIPTCPKCGAQMRLRQPGSTDDWKPFWGCTNYRKTGCRGSKRYGGN